MTTYPKWARGWPCSNEEFSRRAMAVNREPPAEKEGASAYAKYLLTPHWRKLRFYVLVMADSKCALCGELASEVHHLTYERRGRERLEDLMPLCEVCHEAQHRGDELDKVLAGKGEPMRGPSLEDLRLEKLIARIKGAA